MTDKNPPHPMQPLVACGEAKATHGPVIRFKKNGIVDWLQRTGQANLNDIVLLHCAGQFSVEDMEQFWQLLGYSVSGYADLSFVRDETYDEADKKAKELYHATRKELGLE